MNIQPIEDENSRFDLVELKSDSPKCRETPHCKIHGAMLKVSEGGYWRCIQAISLLTGKCLNDCRAGCKQIDD